MRLNGKAAIVTGAGRGIGEAIAVMFAEQGAKVVLCDIDNENLTKVAGRIEGNGGTCLVEQGDIVDREFVKRMVDNTVKTFGEVDVLINNAAITRDAILHKMTEEQWDAVVDVNLKGSFNCLQAVAAHMRSREKGTIINISSTSRFGNPGQLNYSATKGAVVSMTRTAAKELARKKVTCNCVSPGTIMTEMVKAMPAEAFERHRSGVPLGRFGDPEEVANLCLFLASDEASYITGQVINCDGGSFMA